MSPCRTCTCMLLQLWERASGQLRPEGDVPKDLQDKVDRVDGIGVGRAA